MHLRASAGDTEAKETMKKQATRVEALERHFSGGDITLVMPDRTIRTISSRRWLDILAELGQGILAEDTKAVIDSVADNCFETGNGRMTEVIKVMAFGAAQVQAEADSAEGIEETIQ
jgi:nitrous oxidase accessory protein NosD